MISPDYILGLIDGEGSFTVYVRDPASVEQRKRRALAEPRFYIKLIAKDKDILWQLKNFFGCGNIYFQKDNRLNHQDCYRYEVGHRKDLKEIIIPFFKKHQPKLVSRQKDFTIFCQLMELIESKKHLTKAGLREMYSIKQEMH